MLNYIPPIDWEQVTKGYFVMDETLYAVLIENQPHSQLHKTVQECS